MTICECKICEKIRQKCRERNGKMEKTGLPSWWHGAGSKQTELSEAEKACVKAYRYYYEEGVRPGEGLRPVWEIGKKLTEKGDED